MSVTPAADSISARLLSGLILGGMLAVLDSTIVVPILTSIGMDVGGGKAVAWLVIAYLLASTVSTPIWGGFLDNGGERKSFYFALSFFLVGCAAAGLSRNLEELIFARVLQGIGGGGLMPLGQAILAQRVDGLARARLQVYYMLAYGAAAVLGPVLGSLALAHGSWRLVFWIMLPFGLLAAALMRGLLRSKTQLTNNAKIDVWGTCLLFLAAMLTIIGIERLLDANLVPRLLIVAGLVFWWIFFVYEKKIAFPFLPPAVLRNPVIMGSLIISLILGLQLFSFLTYLPVLADRGQGAYLSGLVVLPLTIGWLTLGAFTGRLALWVGTRVLVLLAASLFVIASILIMYFPQTSIFFLAASTAAGLACGLSMIPVFLLCQRASHPNILGRVTSFMVVARNFGSAMGVMLVALVADEKFKMHLDGAYQLPNAFVVTAIAGILLFIVALLFLPSSFTEANMDSVEDE